MIVVGIDSGKNGCISFINDKGEPLLIYDMPKDDKVFLDAMKQTQFKVDAVFLEQVHAMPGQGVTSMFTFGQFYGKAELLAHALGKVTYVTPQTWKKSLGLVREKDEDKTAYKHRSIDKAKKLFPAFESVLTASKDGRAEALLIAYYGLNVMKALDNNSK